MLGNRSTTDSRSTVAIRRNCKYLPVVDLPGPEPCWKSTFPSTVYQHLFLFCAYLFFGLCIRSSVVPDKKMVQLNGLDYAPSSGKSDRFSHGTILQVSLKTLANRSTRDPLSTTQPRWRLQTSTLDEVMNLHVSFVDSSHTCIVPYRRMPYR